MKNSYLECIQNTVICVHSNIRELRERRNFAEPEEKDHIEAKLLAYLEMLSILRSNAEELKLPVEELGLKEN